MPYGTIKVDNITFDNGGTDKLITVSGLFFSTSGALTVTGTISGGNVTAPTATFTTLTGTTTAGTTATFTSGSFTSLTGVTTTVTSGVFGLGSAAAPSIAFSGDANTGIYSPGADQLAIATSGTGRLFVDATGNIGIATAEPTFLQSTPISTYTPKLGVQGSIILASLSATTTDRAELQFYRRASATAGDPISTHDMGRITWYGSSNDLDNANSAFSLGVIPDGGNWITGANRKGSLTFNNNVGEVARIDSSGNVGIGVVPSAWGTGYKVLQTPSASFSSFNTATFILWQNGYYDGTSTKYVNTGYASNYQQINGQHIWNTAPSGTAGNTITFTQAMTLDASGRLGIGATGPTAKLDIVGTGDLELRLQAASDSALIFSETAANKNWKIKPSAGDFVFQYSATAYNSGYSSLLTIKNTGNVGIGTTEPAKNLHIRADSAGSGSTPLLLQNRSVSANTAVGISFAPNVSDSGDRSAIIYGVNSSGGSGNATDLTFHTNANGFSPTEKVRIDSSGRLLVGTSSARTMLSGTIPSLQVEDSTGALSIRRNIAVANPVPANLILGRARGSAFESVISEDWLGNIAFTGADGSAQISAAFISCIVDGTPGANDMPGRLVFSTTADGAASSTERLRITNDGVMCHDQPTPATYAAAATLTVADLKTGIITYTGGAATLTLPTGTLTEGGFSGIYTNMTFEWSVINTGAGICTIGAGTAHTIVGSGSVAIGASARFTSRRTAANTFVSYRLS